MIMQSVGFNTAIILPIEHFTPRYRDEVPR